MNNGLALHRRSLFTAGAAGTLGLAALAGLARVAQAAAPTDQDKANIKLVNNFCKAWEGPKANADNLLSFMTDDCVYQTGNKPIVGKEDVGKRFVAFLPGNITYRLEVQDTFAFDPVVVNVRRDHNITDKGDRILGHIGLFIIKNGKIAEWRDVTYKTT